MIQHMLTRSVHSNTTGRQRLAKLTTMISNLYTNYATKNVELQMLIYVCSVRIAIVISHHQNDHQIIVQHNTEYRANVSASQSTLQVDAYITSYEDPEVKLDRAVHHSIPAFHTVLINHRHILRFHPITLRLAMSMPNV